MLIMIKRKCSKRFRISRTQKIAKNIQKFVLLEAFNIKNCCLINKHHREYKGFALKLTNFECCKIFFFRETFYNCIFSNIDLYKDVCRTINWLRHRGIWHILTIFEFRIPSVTIGHNILFSPWQFAQGKKLMTERSFLVHTSEKAFRWNTFIWKLIKKQVPQIYENNRKWICPILL